MAFLFICVLIVVFVLLPSAYTYYTAFYAPKRKRSNIETPIHGAQYEAVSEYIYKISHIMAKIPNEAVTIPSFDGCQLYGRYYHVKDGAPLMILFHGYRSCAFRDCSGAHALSRKLGFNALVVDQRAHGNSGSKTISFGIKERRDCFCWISYANTRFGDHTPIILWGLSMGAATILMAAGLCLPENVLCMIADSPYSTPSAIIEKVCRDRHYPVMICRPYVHLGALLFGHFRLNSCSAKKSIGLTNIPTLLIHGEEDLLVPFTMSYEIADCCASAIVRTFPNAGHGLSYMIDPVRYEKIIYHFLNSIQKVSKHISDSFKQEYSDKNAKNMANPN